MIRLKKLLSDNLLNIRGWSSHRRIVVIESDDWGSIRMPSAGVYKQLSQSGIPVEKCPYNRFDSLEGENDLNALFDTLSEISNSEGKHPVITANCVVANPDFDKIQSSGFSEYQYEPVTSAFHQYKGCENSFSLWKEGLAGHLFYPQFHGREHLNVRRWMNALSAGLPETMMAFRHRLFGISTTITGETRKSYMAALDFDAPDELEDHKRILADGLHLFENLLGYRSFTFIPTNYTWHSELESTLKKEGINAIQGARVQRQPGTDGTLIKRHFTGETNTNGQIYLVRNASFEPATDSSRDWVDACLKEIALAFFWRRPAIISSHRLNFIGSIVEENRKNNLNKFKELLSGIVNKWPDVEFMTSEELGRLIISDQRSS
ncbi:MAG: hypothetical protein FD166_2646 [Bacteroidetes bacterium]|nr:MAG: hypothetical protein FD166_2646 [Bacteroidota bacterium]